MKVVESLLGEFQSRWAIFRNKDGNKTRMQRFFAVVEIVCFPLSFLSLLLLLVLMVINAMGYKSLFPEVLTKYILPVLLAGAVGYLTNWLAIMMLFHPYEPIKWLFFWDQGLIPKNKPRVAKEIGYQIGNTLLPPEKLADEFCQKIILFFNDKKFVEKLKLQIQDLLTKHEDDIIHFAIPLLEKMIKDSVNEFITPERMKVLWDTQILPRLMDAETRNKISAGVIHFGLDHVGNLTAAIRSYLQKDLTRRCNENLLLRPFTSIIVQIVMDFFADRESIQKMLSTWLGSSETHQMIKSNLNDVCSRLNAWFDSKEGMTQIKILTNDSKYELNTLLNSYLRAMFPIWVRDALASEKVWDLFQNRFLPKARDYLNGLIINHKTEIAKNLNLSQRVEDAINAQDVRKFHEMLNKISAEHLGAIQVLGFILGILIGILQLFQRI